MSEIDKIIYDLFSARWCGDLDTIEKMRDQLRKNLQNQIDGFWSGSTAYGIMTDGGFLKDGKSNTNKKLTKLGEVFMNSFSVNED